MATHIKYTPAEKVAFALVPETCPAVERAIEAAFKAPDFTEAGVAAILAKYSIKADRQLPHALYEVVSRLLFDRKQALTEVVLFEGTFPLRAALVAEVERSRGMAPDRNHFAEWVDAHHSTKAFRVERDSLDARFPAIEAPLSRINPQQAYSLLDDGMGELARVPAAAWAAAHYHATTGVSS